MELPTGQDKRAELFRAVVALRSANPQAFDTCWQWLRDQLSERDRELRRGTDGAVMLRIAGEALCLEKLVAVDNQATESMRRNNGILS